MEATNNLNKDIEVMKFTNNLNKDVEIVADKHVYFIYGKNGVGKTMLSNTLKMDGYETIAFNVNFISSNVYVTTESGEEISTQNTENFTNFILIEEESVALKKELERTQEDRREMNKYEFTKNYQQYIEENFDTSIINEVNTIINNTETTVVISVEFFNDYIDNLKRECNIKTMKEFANNINMVNNNFIISDFLANLDNKKIMGFIDNIEKFNEKLFTYNSLVDKIRKIDSYNPNDNSSIEEWKIAGLELHKDFDSCFFCNNKLGQDYLQLKDYYENKLVLAHNRIKDVTREIMTNIEHVVSSEIYNKPEVGLANELQILRNLLSTLKNIFSLLKDVKEVDSSSYIEPIELSIKKDSLMNVKKELLKYLTITQLEKYIDAEIKIINNSRKQQYLKEAIDKRFEKFIDSETDQINNKVASLGLSERLTLVPYNQSGKKRIKIEINGKKIHQISEGEKHKLALALFLVKLDKLDMNNKIIIFDDPVATLDIQTYFMFREAIISLINRGFNNTNAKLIIMSHDIHYLYVQTSNGSAVNEDKGFVLYKMFNGGQLTKQKLKHLRMDDLSCFSYVLLNMQNSRHFLLTLPLIFKIFRHQLDMIARLNGVDIDITNPSEILSELNKTNILTHKEQRDVQKFSNQLSALKGTTSICVKEMKNLYGEYFNVMDILNIPMYYDKKIYEQFDDSDVVDIHNIEKGDEVIYDLLIELWLVLFINEDSNERKYLSHPNNQITRNLVAFDFQ